MKYLLFALFIAGIIIGYGWYKTAAEENQKSVLSAAQAWEKIKTGAIVVDVRRPDEYQTGHIDGALNIPYDQIASRIEEVSTDKNREIILYCRSGRRSGIAREILKNLGYTAVHNAGGYTDLMR